jgi:16S rRNA (guanine966-N2)-methyltransferase
VPDGGRVITGAAKGLRLLAPGQGTRPLGDRVKQAVFATLEAELSEVWPVTFLDLFAGSGAAGVEALSRGARVAVFVERDERAARIIAENLRRTGLAGGRVVRDDVLRFLAGGARAVEGAPFGAAMVDPPYGDASIVDALELLGDPARRWLADRAIVVAKHFWRDDLPARSGWLAGRRTRRFGETGITFYVYEADEREARHEGG